MMGPGALALRDIHVPPAPGWWPPAPGWWLLAILVLGTAGSIAWLLWRRVQRRRRLQRMFDRHVAAAASASGRLAAISGLLRRAALQHDSAAATLHGDAWLAYLERDPAIAQLDRDARVMLSEGAYRRDPGEFDLQGVHDAARACFLQMAGGRR